MRILLVDQSLDFCAIVAAWLNEFFGAVWVESAASGGAECQRPRQEHRARRIQRRAAEIS